MEMLLVGVTIISLLLAITMSAVAWTLWQSERQRAAARAEALEALAFSDAIEERPQVIHVPPVPARRVEHRVAPEPRDEDQREAVRAETTVDADEWDFALGGARGTGIDAPRPDRDRSRAPVLPDEMFNGAQPSGPSGRLWLALAAVALVITAGVVMFRALHSPELIAAFSASSKTPVENVGGAHPLELLSLRHVTGADGAFTVTGLVQNPPDGQSLDQIEAVVYLFDDDGRYFASGKAALDVPTIAAGDESPFVVKVPMTGNVSRYRVGFRRTDGRVVAHIDRRGQLPAGTTGDAIDAQPALASPAGVIRRAEGTLTR